MMGSSRSRAPVLAGLIVLALILGLRVDIARAEPEFPALTGRVVDNANLLEPGDQQALVSELENLEKKTGDQLVVVTLPSLQGYEIADFGYQLGRKWGIGQAGKDNGALLIVAPNERRVRIEVGRKLEPILTDAASKLIIENGITPKFRQGDFPGGVKAGVRDIVAMLTGDTEVVEQLRQTAEHQAQPAPPWLVISIWFVILLIVIWIMWRSAGRGGGRGGPIIFAPGGSGGGWDSGGGFSGGGGDFGGGGASGSW